MKRLPLRAFSVVFLAPALVLALGIALALQAVDATGQAAEATSRLDRALARPAAEPVMRGSALLVPGDSAGTAASAFQAAVRAVATSAGAEVLQVESAPLEASAPLTRLPLTVHLRGTEAQIVAALAALETSAPLVRVDRLDLQGEGQENGVLSAALVLSAWSGEVQP